MIGALIVAALAMATVFLVLGILAGCTSLLGRSFQKGTGLRLEQEKEMIALFSALYAWLPDLKSQTGEYTLQLGAEKRRLQVEEWVDDHGTIHVNGKPLEVKIEPEDRNGF